MWKKIGKEWKKEGMKSNSMNKEEKVGVRKQVNLQYIWSQQRDHNIQSGIH